MVACSHSQDLAAALEAAGSSPVELWTIPNADHGWHGVSDAQVEQIFTDSLAFALRLVS